MSTYRFTKRAERLASLRSALQATSPRPPAVAPAALAASTSLLSRGRGEYTNAASPAQSDDFFADLEEHYLSGRWNAVQRKLRAEVLEKAAAGAGASGRDESEAKCECGEQAEEEAFPDELQDHEVDQDEVEVEQLFAFDAAIVSQPLNYLRLLHLLCRARRERGKNHECERIYRLLFLGADHFANYASAAQFFLGLKRMAEIVAGMEEEGARMSSNSTDRATWEWEDEDASAMATRTVRVSVIDEEEQERSRLRKEFLQRVAASFARSVQDRVAHEWLVEDASVPQAVGLATSLRQILVASGTLASENACFVDVLQAVAARIRAEGYGNGGYLFPGQAEATGIAGSGSNIFGGGAGSSSCWLPLLVLPAYSSPTAQSQWAVAPEKLCEFLFACREEGDPGAGSLEVASLQRDILRHLVLATNPDAKLGGEGTSPSDVASRKRSATAHLLPAGGRSSTGIPHLDCIVAAKKKAADRAHWVMQFTKCVAQIFLKSEEENASDDASAWGSSADHGSSDDVLTPLLPWLARRHFQIPERFPMDASFVNLLRLFRKVGYRDDYFESYIASKLDRLTALQCCDRKLVRDEKNKAPASTSPVGSAEILLHGVAGVPRRTGKYFGHDLTQQSPEREDATSMSW